MEVEALEVWKRIKLFVDTQQDGPAIVYHLKLAQQLLADVG